MSHSKTPSKFVEYFIEQRFIQMTKRKKLNLKVIIDTNFINTSLSISDLKNRIHISINLNFNVLQIPRNSLMLLSKSKERTYIYN